MMARTYLLALLVLAVSAGVQAQERLGLKLGNYSGINGITLNPAAGTGSYLKWDVNVIALGVFAENNYIFVQDANLIKVLRNRNNIVMATNLNTAEGASTNTDQLIADFTQGNGHKFANVDAFVMGPSAMFRVKQHTFGIYWGSRVVTSGRRVPSSLGYYDLDALDSGDSFTVDRFKTAGAFFSEVGLNYGTNVLRHGKHKLDVGGTVKLLLGHDGFFFNNMNQTTITLYDDYMTYDHAKVHYGVANNIDGYGAAGEGYDFNIRGFGVAADIGVVYKLKTNRKHPDYTWKLGVSVLDIGYIRFGKQAQQHIIETDSPFDFIQSEYAGVENFDEVYQILSEQSLDNELASFSDDKFALVMPAGLAVQAERYLGKGFYVNATVVRALPMPGAAIRRTDIVAITPRYEHRWFEASLPLVLLNDRDPRLGLALRLGPVVLGSDNLTSFFGSHNFTGSDIYMAIKINPASLKRGGGTGNQGQPDKPSDCYYF